MAILLITFVVALLVRSRRQLSLHQLRLLELLVFGSLVFQLSLMMLSRMASFAEANDATSMVSVRQQFLMAWCVIIFIYGIMMPNNWKRGAIVMLSAASVPYLLGAYKAGGSPNVASLLNADQANSALPLPMVAAIIAAFGTHVINSARREVFKARQFGQYRLLEHLGAGGMGDVYKAEHVLLKRPCAIKLIKPQNEADVAVITRFEKEVKATAKLSHWNTVEIFDFGCTDDGTFYYVMELLPGLSLEEIVERHGPMSPGRVVHLLRQICGALQEAHEVGLIHRDIKPANIFAAKRGGVQDVAKLLDFGLVKERADRSTDSGARAGAFSGTPLYMSPEQATSYEDVDGRADIYSLGAVAYYLLTGQPPFASRNVIELLRAHASTEVPPPSRLNADIPADVEQIILQCLAKTPTGRYQDVVRLRHALAQCSVANDWGPEQANAWWKAHTEQSPDPLTSAPLDATIDCQISMPTLDAEENEVGRPTSD